jgi:putative effector of murein hydrolase
MSGPIALDADTIAQAFFWSASTIALYLAAKAIYRRWPRWWLAPLLVTPVLLMVAILSLHASYRDYIRGTHWLVALLGPATVAFAVPIYEQRGLIRSHWPILVAGVLAGSTTSMLSAWGLATLLGLDAMLRLSLLPRSMSTPFAMTVSGDIGGVPDLTAVFVVLTGVFGAALGETLLARLPNSGARRTHGHGRACRGHCPRARDRQRGGSGCGPGHGAGRPAERARRTAAAPLSEALISVDLVQVHRPGGGAERAARIAAALCDVVGAALANKLVGKPV